MNQILLPGYELAPTVQPCPVLPIHRILLAEDDCGVRNLMTKVLKSSGYHVDTAGDGSEAWNALHADGYHLLITDNDMPKVSGIELLRKIRKARMEVPVIMASGQMPHEEFTRHPWLRPAATLLKPYSIGDLIATVRAVLHPACGRMDPPRTHGG